MCLLRSRVRSPSSAGWAPCREGPGRSGGGGTSGSLSRQERGESPGGEALTAVSLAPRERRALDVNVRLESFPEHACAELGSGRYNDHQACRPRRRCACAPLADWVLLGAAPAEAGDQSRSVLQPEGERLDEEDRQRRRLQRSTVLVLAIGPFASSGATRLTRSPSLTT
jgi:hypothetical protein